MRLLELDFNGFLLFEKTVAELFHSLLRPLVSYHIKKVNRFAAGS